ncbi:MAG: hypothetical protein L0Z47_05585, partial [Actinobacteria bacterium]|nr:hypothetical protein [Actinomycetota bacterium]
KRAEAQRLAAERAEAERLAAERVEAERVEAERVAAERAVKAKHDRRDQDMVKEVLGTSTSDDPDSSKELVVDLGEYESEPVRAPEPVVAAAVKEKSGFMGTVRSAFTRNGRNHEHDFVEAPGGLGLSRFICRECGFVSISAND